MKKLRNKTWGKRINPIIIKHKSIINTLKYNSNVVPNEYEWFKAFERCPYNKLKVVILGSDPYPNKNDACGLAFSVIRDYNIPRTLNNIFKTLKVDLKIENTNGNLNSWARQGVLLLNSSLTTEKGLNGGHIKLWEPFIIDIIKILNRKKQPIVWSLWGNQAKAFKKYIGNNNIILEHVHPSPRVKHNEFVFSKPFSKINKSLNNLGYIEIDWKT